MKVALAVLLVTAPPTAAAPAEEVALVPAEPSGVPLFDNHTEVTCDGSGLVAISSRVIGRITFARGVSR